MANQVKRRAALAGIPVRSYNVYDMEMLEQYKQTNEYKAKKALREELIVKAKKKGKVNYNDIYNKVYPKPKYKVRARY